MNYNSNDPDSLPTCIAGVDWRALQKGQTIESRKIVEMFHVLFNKDDVLEHTSDVASNFQHLQVKGWLETVRLSIGKPLVFQQKRNDLRVLTDEEAVKYLNGQAYQGLNKHKRNTRRMFTHINTDNLSQHQRDQLSVNQSRHAMIASAADGARREALEIQRKGGQFPKLMPPNL